MDNLKRMYRQSEKRLAPKRKCPDCGITVRPYWKGPLPDLNDDLDPEFIAVWRCLDSRCLVGSNEF
ncbi:hypothetical protein [Streptomyces rimosus]|uniref:hypothetical protein n=1 Tax=Streptomyces rimosus TaxID=1927 RepID=UPI0006B25CBC|nr:hypothetical protein [Streptomyces rimosus]